MSSQVFEEELRPCPHECDRQLGARLLQAVMESDITAFQVGDRCARAAGTQEPRARAVRVAIDHDGGVDVMGEAGLCPRRYRETRDECPRPAAPIEIRCKAPQSGLKNAHSNLRDGRPAASPCGAAGLDSRQAWSIASISSSAASG
jgi:hypothetical protein